MIEIKHTKRYVLIFNLLDPEEKKYSKIISRSYSEFDTETECNEELELYKELYREEIQKKQVGCAILDYKEFKITKVIGYGVYVGTIYIRPSVKSKSEEYWKWQDQLFRGPDEIPKNYNWDDGEYQGWLKFRWGDGSNSINKEIQKINRNKKKKLPPLVKEDLL